MTTTYTPKSAREDFNDHVNGTWLSSASIPDDQTRWGSFMILNEQNLERLKAICEAHLELPSFVGKLFKLATEDRSSSPSTELQALFNKVQAIADKDQFYTVVAELFQTAGVSVFIHICKSEDAKNTELRVPHVSQSGLSLPDKSYYTDREDLWEPFKEYIKNITQLFNLSDVDAEGIFNFEKAVAEKHLSPVQRRDPDLTYNKKDYKDEVCKLMPGFFQGVDFGSQKDKLSYFILDNPDLLAHQVQTVEKTDLKVLKDLLLFKLCDTFAAFSSEAIQQARFEFRGKKLSGQKTMDPKWKRGVRFVERHIGDELGKLYVAKHFPKEKQETCRDMVGSLKDALRETLKELTWMSDNTKAEALQKLEKFGVKIGVPEEWHSIDGLWTSGFTSVDDAVMQWNKWDWETQEVAKFYTPPERKLWLMTPQTVNAYYHPEMNEIVFPAGILQPPFFSLDTFEENIGAIGVVIGHEMTHGFDDQGRKYNASGELKDWWTEEDSKQFDERAAPVRDHYGAQLVHGKPVNGQLTLGENIADIGGLKLALRALKLRGAIGQDADKDKATLTRFFTAYAKIWCMLVREEMALKLLAVDPHSPCHLRVNCALSHIPEFYETFGVADGDGQFLKPEARMNIW